MEINQKKQTPDHVENHMVLWNQVKHVSPGMLKGINGGNLNGKTDINPVWRFQTLTERFGPCGIGWTVKEKERWTNECAGEVGAFVKVELRICIAGTWSEPIEGVGGSKLCGKGRGDGLNDEAWKMATTDAISVACKSLGMAADVYSGKQSHNDADQQGSGGDYRSKYETRNDGKNSSQSHIPAPRSSSAPRGGNWAASAPSTAAPAPAVNQRRTVTLEAIKKGKAKRLITELSQHDYDDAADWRNGLDALKAQYDYAPGAIDEIQKLAVQEREARIQGAIDRTGRQLNSRIA
jgi:hypothetical protein